ncbi:MAG: hypothetical protein K0S68_553 [Candidatus Saccharibacteria bacterium]|jgi:hypothetical protein|nr:hypothetical protein [Candidatus Saccharibacteria bacterium]
MLILIRRSSGHINTARDVGNVLDTLPMPGGYGREFKIPPVQAFACWQRGHTEIDTKINMCWLGRNRRPRLSFRDLWSKIIKLAQVVNHMLILSDEPFFTDHPVWKMRMWRESQQAPHPMINQLGVGPHRVKISSAEPCG